MTQIIYLYFLSIFYSNVLYANECDVKYTQCIAPHTLTDIAFAEARGEALYQKADSNLCEYYKKECIEENKYKSRNDPH
jgi:hypothetical protein